MKYYDPKNWLFGLLYFNKTDTIHLLKKPLMVMAFYTILIAILEIEVFKIGESSGLKNVSMIHSTLGFVLSLLLVFRTNTAYDRWWEGRKLWGQLTNVSNNMAVKINAILPKDDVENRMFFKKNLSFFPFLLARHLVQKQTMFELDSSFMDLQDFDKRSNPIVMLFNRINLRCSKLYQDGVIDQAQHRYLEYELNQYLNISGGCERIKNTPIPFSYSSFIKRFIVIYVIALPVAYSMTIGYATIPLTLFVFYVLMSLELIAEDIEDPFNEDINDIPTYRISQNIQKNIEDVFKSQELGQGNKE